MKNYATDMMKLIAMLIVTPVLVMAYTKIERSIAATAPVEQGGVNAVTPVTIGLMDNADNQRTDTAFKNDYLLVRYMGPSVGTGEKEISFTNNMTTANRFALAFL